MANPTTDAGINDSYAEIITIPAGNGTKTTIGRREGFDRIMMSGDADFRMAFSPKIYAMYFYDSAAVKYTNMLDADKSLINRHVAGATGTLLNDMLVTDDFIYIGTQRRHGGFFIDVTNVNGTSNTTMKMEYSRSNGNWTDTAISDGTSSGSISLAQDGNVTINTVPTNWARASLLKDMGNAEIATLPLEKYFWVRISFTTAGLDAATSIAQLLAFHQDHNVDDVSGADGMYDSGVEYIFNLGADVGGLELMEQNADSGTKKVTINYYAVE